MACVFFKFENALFHSLAGFELKKYEKIHQKRAVLVGFWGNSKELGIEVTIFKLGFSLTLQSKPIRDVLFFIPWYHIWYHQKITIFGEYENFYQFFVQ